ncbi:hypothetical protein [Xylella fastidiosa]|uniref:hypothetical protein n=1 Tax=Xylella fastidiosa TaxID=2371 RepID=UPI0021CD08BF|nr:hypothetical protein [Xylella fastidiosa]
MAGIWALSNDGKIAAGYSSSNKQEGKFIRAVVWSGKKWATKTDLGTLQKDNLGSSYVTALSSDGKIAVGYAETDSKSLHAIIWSGEN